MPPIQTPTVVLTPTPTKNPTPAGVLGDTQIRLKDKMVMVFVPGGEFKMGSGKSNLDYALELCDTYYAPSANERCQRAWFKNEQPVYSVTLDPYWMDSIEVINAQYRRCVEAGACDPPKTGLLPIDDAYYGNSGYDDYPVVFVAWHHAAAYSEWAAADRGGMGVCGARAGAATLDCGKKGLGITQCTKAAIPSLTPEGGSCAVRLAG
jgi:formylglycine-generating enzyme required for sulfatase activity